MKQEVAIGQVDYTVLVKIRDTAGAPVTGLDETDIDIAYVRVETDNDVVTTDVTPATLAALTTAHTDWGFEEVSATDHPGLYRLDIADAVFASGAWSAVVTVTGTGLDPADMEFVLVPQSPLTGVQLAPVTHTSATIPTVTTTGTATAVTTVNGLAANVITAASIATGAIDADALAADAGTEIGTAVWATATRSLTVLDEDSTTLDLDATIRAAVGLAAANLDTQLGAIDDLIDLEVAAIKTVVDAILVDTNELQTDWADGGRLDLILDARASQASVNTIDDFIDTEIGAIITALADVPTNAELATALGTADDAVLAAIAALNDFDPATDEVLANVQKINDVTIVGDGSGTPFNV